MALDLAKAYAEKMRGWDDTRLKHELSYIPNAGNAWGTEEVMTAWNTSLKAEAERRGLTVPA